MSTKARLSQLLRVLLLGCLLSAPGVTEAACTGGVCAVPNSGDPFINGANLQSAINAAVYGDTIVLTPGVEYRVAPERYIDLPDKGPNPSGQFIVIRTSNLAGLPPQGTRVDPAVHATAMAQVTAQAGANAFSGSARAKYYKLTGLDVTDANLASPYASGDLIAFGQRGSAPGGYMTYAELFDTGPFIVDRCFIHPSHLSAQNLASITDTHTGAVRGIALGGVNLTVVDSYVAGFVGYVDTTNRVKGDNLGIYSIAGPGPITITNNYISAWFNNIFFGGGGQTVDPAHVATITAASLTNVTLSTVQDLQIGDLISMQTAPSPQHYPVGRVIAINGAVVSFVPVGAYNSGQNPLITTAPMIGGTAMWRGEVPRGLTVQRNTLDKPIAWQTLVPDASKMYVEVKAADGLLIDGNVLTGFHNSAPGLTVRNQITNGGNGWVVIKNVTISNNLIRGYGNLALQLLDNEFTATPGGNILITNNLFTGEHDTTQEPFALAAGSNVTLRHNTVRVRDPGYSVFRYLSGPGVNLGQQWSVNAFTVSDNIVQYGLYGLAGGGSWLTNFLPNGPVENTGNVVIDTLNVGTAEIRTKFANSQIAASLTAVGFANLVAADAGDDYHGYALAPNSPYKGTASDGKDPGVDFAALDAALGGQTPTLGAPTGLAVR
jgi:hypothetical protein